MGTERLLGGISFSKDLLELFLARGLVVLFLEGLLKVGM